MVGKVLLVGESWVSVTTHYKGFNNFVSGDYDTGVAYFRRAMDGWCDWVHMPGHETQAVFPLEGEKLKDYSVIILSDIGADTFLLHPKTWVNGERTPNRLRLLEEFVQSGGGLIMAGGYLSYQGINGAARYHGSPVEEALPVELEPYDDRVECPEGVQPKVVKTEHVITNGLEETWPYLLGYNRVRVKKGVEVLATVQADPLLIVGGHGRGRAVAWMSDIGPHWCPREFAEWKGYTELWRRMITWASGE
ncbi:MAG: glutamine amidotransferase [Candidatus Bathyarchaeia archaeon]